MPTNSWDPTWEDVFQRQEWGKYPGEPLIRFVAKNFYKSERSSVRILELGCGTGANLWYMSREGFSVYGIDGSTTAISFAKKRLETEGLKADIQVGDIVNLPYPPDYFDAVIDNECIYANNWSNSRKIVQNVFSVLKKEGKFFSRTFSEKMSVGKQPDIISALEYNNIKEGPLAGKGFVRLADKESIQDLYGSLFNIESVDLLEYTLNNQTIQISEYIIICSK